MDGLKIVIGILCLLLGLVSIIGGFYIGWEGEILGAWIQALGFLCFGSSFYLLKS